MNGLYYGDNLDILRAHIASESVDLIYLDPPFNSNASYNVLFKAPDGHDSHAQMEAFEDTWHWNKAAERAFDEVMQSGNTDAAEMLRAMRSFLHENDMMAYLAMMAVRLLELHRVLKPSGSLYLHCDPTASHYLKLLLDAIFGPREFLNEVIWKRTFAHGSAKRYGPVHDTLLFFARDRELCQWTNFRIPHSDEYTSHFRQLDAGSGRRFQAITLTGAGVRSGESGRPWRGIDPTAVKRHWALPGKVLSGLGVTSGTVQERLDELDRAGLIYWPDKTGGTPRLKQFEDELEGVSLGDVWTDIPPISAQARERLGYPTQKPLALMERVLQASSKEGDIVLDPFCGCGTTVHAAQKLNRQWIGVDITHLAISLIQKRLRDAFGPIPIVIHGVPRDLGGARALAAQDKYQFQWWAVSLVDAVPYGGRKKGADSGIDGFIYFKPDGKTTEKAIVSVKGGDSVDVKMVRELAQVVNRENAKMGVLISLAEPTGPMRKEAIAEGFYKTEYGEYPKLQILTIAHLFAGQRPDMPWIDPTVFRKAKAEKGRQEKLL
ncbi:MAG TPA: DNA methyltransferase [Rhizomicrobium sp.]|jgi:site-specific DNA-methyltransferase (adenine-specific)|nr:DNA methyltransferase [Rhizomicrobium sp.]